MCLFSTKENNGEENQYDIQEMRGVACQKQGTSIAQSYIYFGQNQTSLHKVRMLPGH